MTPLLLLLAVVGLLIALDHAGEDRRVPMPEALEAVLLILAILAILTLIGGRFH